MRIFFSFTILCKHTCMYLHLQTYLHARVCVRSFYKREENRESETIKVVQSINERKKKKKKLEKKKRKRIDACTVYFHHFWILCTLTLLIYGIFVDVYRTTKREIGGQPFNDTIRSLFFFTMITMFFCREALLRLHNYRSKCGAWKISLQYFFSSYFGGMQMHLRGTFWHE